ncbi:MAG: HlyC/CorC family transporter [Clostridia bacterium]|nr:HlyC/CorC family transporter [Clostridia bacterium]
MNVLPYVISMIGCLILSAFFSATETAFLSINKTRMKTLVEKGNKRAKLVLALSDQYDKLISTILICNNIVNIAIASLGTVLFIGLLGNVGAAVSTAVVTVAVLIFGEITPKNIAKDRPDKFAMFSAPIIRSLIILLTPLNFLFTLWKKMISKLFFRRPEEETKMSQEELLMLVDEVEQEGSIDEDEGSLLRNVIEFTDLKAEEILTNRAKLEGFPRDASKEEIAKLFSETKYSRLLVYEEDLDHIVGVLHQKDFYTDNGITEQSLEELITPPLFIPQSTKISDLLKLLQNNQSHIAIVVDEYGETLGIVTMEDILEELVGEIWDEHDEVIENFTEICENAYRVSCDVSLDEFKTFFDVEIESGSSTLNGWITEQICKLAEPGDAFSFGKLSVTVVTVESHRAKTANVVVTPEEKLEEEADGED